MKADTVEGGAKTLEVEAATLGLHLGGADSHQHGAVHCGFCQGAF